MLQIPEFFLPHHIQPLIIATLPLPRPGADGSSAVCRAEVRRWRPGGYTLVHDHDTTQQEAALDARLCIGADDWADELGGVTSYIARGEDTEVSPEAGESVKAGVSP